MSRNEAENHFSLLAKCWNPSVIHIALNLTVVNQLFWHHAICKHATAQGVDVPLAIRHHDHCYLSYFSARQQQQFALCLLLLWEIRNVIQSRVSLGQISVVSHLDDYWQQFYYKTFITNFGDDSESFLPCNCANASESHNDAIAISSALISKLWSWRSSERFSWFNVLLSSVLFHISFLLRSRLHIVQQSALLRVKGETRNVFLSLSLRSRSFN